MALAMILLAALNPLSGRVVASELDYQLDYDYPELTSGEYGSRFSPSDFWRDFGALSAIPTQQGVDYPQSYLPPGVGFRQGPPIDRVRFSHSRYEFLFRFTENCLQSLSSPCPAELFGDRFESP